jgi:hypothetical protein
MFTFRAQEVRHSPGITVITIIKRLLCQSRSYLRQGHRQQ